MKITTVDKKLKKLANEVDKMPWSFRRIFINGMVSKPDVGAWGRYNFGGVNSDTDYATIEEAIEACEDMLAYLKGKNK